MSAADVLLTVLILFALFVLAYTKYQNKTLVEFAREVREIFKRDKEEVIDL